MPTKQVVKFQKPVAAASPLKLLKAEPVTVKIKSSVDPGDFKRLETLTDRIEHAAAIAAVAADSLNKPEANRQRLHRRVLVTVYDAAGKELYVNRQELKASESASFTVSGDGISVNIGPTAAA